MFYRREYYKIRPFKLQDEVTCNDSINPPSGQEGVYRLDINLGSDTGITKIRVDSQNIPDRFQIVYNSNVVADSLFVGDGLPNASYESSITSITTLDEYVYNATTNQYELSGNQESVNFTSADIAVSDGTETRADGSGTNQLGVVQNIPSSTALASNGEVELFFNKNLPDTTTATLVAYGINNTAWTFVDITCPFKRYYTSRGGADCTSAIDDTLDNFYVPDGITIGNPVYLSIDFSTSNKAPQGIWGISTSSSGTPQFVITVDSGGDISAITEC